MLKVHGIASSAHDEDTSAEDEDHLLVEEGKDNMSVAGRSTFIGALALP